MNGRQEQYLILNSFYLFLWQALDRLDPLETGRWYQNAPTTKPEMLDIEKAFQRFQTRTLENRLLQRVEKDYKTVISLIQRTQDLYLKPFKYEQARGSETNTSAVYSALRDEKNYLAKKAVSFARRAASPMDIAEGHSGEIAKTILVAEPEEYTRTFARERLEEAGYEVLLASDGPEALALVDGYDGPIDIVLTEVSMPSMDGLELAKRLKQVRPKTKVIFLTAEGIEPHAVSIKGAQAFLKKPMSPATLRRKIRQVLQA